VEPVPLPDQSHRPAGEGAGVEACILDDDERLMIAVGGVVVGWGMVPRQYMVITIP